jgi:hypothetical protein
LLQLIHHLLPFFNGTETHSKLLRLFDGAIVSSLG